MKKTTEKLPIVDYTKLPKDLEETVEPTPEEISDKAKIGFDGRQYFVRFPSEIAKLMNITIEDYVDFKFIKPHPKIGGKPILKIELMQK